MSYIYIYNQVSGYQAHHFYVMNVVVWARRKIWVTLIKRLNLMIRKIGQTVFREHMFSCGNCLYCSKCKNSLTKITLNSQDLSIWKVRDVPITYIPTKELLWYKLTLALMKVKEEMCHNIQYIDHCYIWSCESADQS